MQTIDLPLCRCMRLGAWGLVLFAAALALAAPTPWPWRIAGAVSIIAAGALSWRRYLRTRPRALGLTAGALVCTCGDGSLVPVRRVAIGVARPSLVSVRLHGAGGERLDLFVPGPALASEVHWRLRRALLAFREDRAQSGAAPD